MDQVDEVVAHWPKRCAHCGGRLAGAHRAGGGAASGDGVARAAVVVVEHQAMACGCRRCGKESAGKIPVEVKKSVCGPRLSGMMGYLSARMAVSRRQVRRFFRACWGEALQRQCLCPRAGVGRGVERTYGRIAGEVRGSEVVNIDETGWKGAARWLWWGRARKPVFIWPGRIGPAGR